MRTRVLLVGLASALGLGLLVLGLTAAARQAQAAGLGAVVAWDQVNVSGFGNSENGQVPSLAVFNDQLYAGVWGSNGITLSAEIWRSSTGTDWEKVDERDAVNGTAALIVFQGQLYAGSWGDGYVSQVWRTPDGLNWTDVITDGFGDANNGVARLAVYSDTLYASTWNGTTGTELWRSADGSVWDQFGQSGLDGTPDNAAAIASAIYAGSLYWGVTNAATGGQLWRTDGVTYTAIITDGFGTSDNWGISSLASFDGYLYAGLVNGHGAQVWRSPDGELGWTRVVSSSSISPTIGGINGLEVFAGQLYLVAQNFESGLEVWRTANGTEWEQIGFAGLGDIDTQWSYWDNALLAFQGRLYVGTNNFTSGGQVWRLTAHRLFLPIIFGP